jgi:hypothetical protein
MKFKSIFFTGFIVLCSLLNAQTDFRSGYVISLNGDTLYGEIDYRGDELMSRICKFRADKNRNIKQFSPDDIKAYRFTDSKFYVSKEYKGEKEFLEFLINGVVDIYYLRDITGDHYFIDKEDSQLTEIPYSEGIKYINNQPYFYASKSFQGILWYYMKDAPDFKKRIEIIEKPDHQSLIKLAEDYNNAVCKDEKCIVYERKVPLIKISLEPRLGLIKYTGYGKFVNEIGGLVYFWIPRANEKLYFKTGILLNIIDDSFGKLDIYKIPLQIQYLYPSGKLKPQLSFGFDFFAIKMEGYKDMTHTLCINAGLHYKMSKNLDLSAGFNSDYTSLIYVFSEKNTNFSLVSYSVSLGLYIRL